LKLLKKDASKYKIPKDNIFDYIIHAVSIASPIFYRKYPIETINGNVQGLYRILEYLLARKKLKGLLRVCLIFHRAKFMVILPTEIFPRLKIIEEMFPAQGQGHAMTSQKDFARRCV